MWECFEFAFLRKFSGSWQAQSFGAERALEYFLAGSALKA